MKSEPHRVFVSDSSLILLMEACFFFPLKGQLKLHRLVEFTLIFHLTYLNLYRCKLNREPKAFLKKVLNLN